MSYELRTPNGTYIKGTLETITGVAMISIEGANPNGTFAYDYEGETDIDWNSQTTVENDKGTVFVDDDGDQWSGDQLVLVEGEWSGNTFEEYEE